MKKWDIGEIEDIGDVGDEMCLLLAYSPYREMFLNVFKEILEDYNYEGLLEVVEKYKEEQEENKDDWL